MEENDIKDEIQGGEDVDILRSSDQNMGTLHLDSNSHLQTDSYGSYMQIQRARWLVNSKVKKLKRTFAENKCQG